MTDEALPADQKTQQASHATEIKLQRCKIVVPGTRPNEVELGDGEMAVGNSSACDVTIRDVTVSRRHATITHEDGGYLLRDLDSTNGTFIDGVRVREGYVHAGSTIRFGTVDCRVEPIFRTIDLAPSEHDFFGPIIGRSLAMRRIFAALERVSSSNASVLLQGETGVGKTSIARALHELGPRTEGPFVVFDCGSAVPSLIESALFGHEKGAFTGATSQRRGALEVASGGTLFIDELTELPAELQPKLLGALEERQITRVGSTTPISIDCRIIAASQRDLWSEVTEDRFRKDLYFRLAVITVTVPPLRDRKDDIPDLVERFLRISDDPRAFAELSEEVRQYFLSQPWVGNIRELRNAVERYCVMNSVEALYAGSPGVDASESATDADLTIRTSSSLPFKEARAQVLSELESQYVRKVMELANHNVTEAAQLAGLGRRHMYNLLEKHGWGRNK